MKNKTCKSCNEIKSTSEFYKISNKDYYHAYCKICHGSKNKLIGQINKEKSKSKIGFIYILENPVYKKHIKIGKTFHLSSRLSTYNTGSPFKDYYYSYTKETEYYKIIENYFNDNFNSENEWYELTREEAITIIENILLGIKK